MFKTSMRLVVERRKLVSCSVWPIPVIFVFWEPYRKAYRLLTVSLPVPVFIINYSLGLIAYLVVVTRHMSSQEFLNITLLVPVD